MIPRPLPGQRVVVHYATSKAQFIGHNDLRGVVLVAGTGPGPINAAVMIDDKRVVVPFRRGNLKEG